MTVSKGGGGVQILVPCFEVGPPAINKQLLPYVNQIAASFMVDKYGNNIIRENSYQKNDWFS